MEGKPVNVVVVGEELPPKIAGIRLFSWLKRVGRYRESGKLRSVITVFGVKVLLYEG
jgi:hypothetical protein